ncbi:DUF6233 domain-containing protein [Streptomyces sp. NPDC054861]
MLSIPERLEKQRSLLEWLRWQLHQTEQTIWDLEAEEKEEARRREVARREMSWKIQPSRAVEGHPMLHRGACEIDRRQYGFISRDEVITAFEEFPEMELCDVCKPWGSLGIDKPPPRRLPGDSTP